MERQDKSKRQKVELGAGGFEKSGLSVDNVEK